MTAENPNTIWLLRSMRNVLMEVLSEPHTQSHSKYTAHSNIQLPISLHSAGTSEDDDSVQSGQNPQTQQPPNWQSTLPSCLQMKYSTLITGNLLFVGLYNGLHFHSQETRLWGQRSWSDRPGTLCRVLWHGSKVTVVWECCYAMEVRWRWYGSVVMPWK